MNLQQNDRERLIERYMHGELAGAEQQDFLHLLAADPELRRILDAEQTIERAMRKDLQTFPVDHSRTRNRALAALAATSIGGAAIAGEAAYAATSSATSGTAAGGTAATGAGTAGVAANGTVAGAGAAGAASTAGVGGIIAGLGAVKTAIISLAAAAAVTTGTLTFTGVLTQNDTPKEMPAAAPAPAATVPTLPAPTVTAPEAELPPAVVPQTETVSPQETIPTQAVTPSADQRGTRATETRRAPERTTESQPAAAPVNQEPAENPAAATDKPKTLQQVQDKDVKAKIDFRTPTTPKR